MVVVSFRENLNLRRLERFVALINAGGIESVVVLTKEDLSTDPDGESERVRREIGAEVLVVSAQTGWGMVRSEIACGQIDDRAHGNVGSRKRASNELLARQAADMTGALAEGGRTRPFTGSC